VRSAKRDEMAFRASGYVVSPSYLVGLAVGNQQVGNLRSVISAKKRFSLFNTGQRD